jgi:hypothetical protein
MTPCNLAYGYESFGEVCLLHVQDKCEWNCSMDGLYNSDLRRFYAVVHSLLPEIAVAISLY